MTSRFERRLGSWNRVSLVIHSDDLTPEEITEALSVTPTTSVAKGSTRGPGSKPLEAHLWSLECTLGKDVIIDDQIAWLLDQVEPRIQELARLINERHCSVRIQAAMSDKSGQYPLTFDAELLRRLTVAPLDIWLTWWVPETEDSSHRWDV